MLVVKGKGVSLKKPKLPRGILFADEEGLKMSQENGWEALKAGLGEPVMTILVRGRLRRYRYPQNKPLRVLFAEGVDLSNYQTFGREFEEVVENFVSAALAWSKEQRFKREALSARRTYFPETNRVMKPVRFKGNPNQSRINYRERLR